MRVAWVSLHPETVMARSYYDQAIIEDLLAGRFGPVPHAEHVEGPQSLADGAGASGVVVVPARHHTSDTDVLRAAVDAWAGAVLILAGDEEGDMPQGALGEVPTWVMTPRRVLAEHERGLPTGYTPHTRTVPLPVKDVGWWFSGQVTHPGRRRAVAALRNTPDGHYVATPSFTAGLPANAYAKELARCKVAPAPSGPVTPDTMRCWEALQVGAVPLVDAVSPSGERGYWPRALGEAPPFPVLNSWKRVPVLIGEMLEDWPWPTVHTGAWWTRWRRSFHARFVADLSSVGVETHVPVTTFLVVTSPIPTHPDTAIIEATIDSIRERSDDPIHVWADGIHPSQHHYREAYGEYLRRMTHLCMHRWSGVSLNVAESWLHQSGMTRRALDHIDTDTVTFVEHDTPLVGDIPLTNIAGVVTSGLIDVVRLHHEASVLDVHRYLMQGDVDDVLGVPLWLTRQWSQRPHVASTDYYRRILRDCFGQQARTMIEDVMYGIVYEAGERRDWDSHRIAIYHPDGDIKRSTHLDGRGDDEKVTMVWEYDHGVPAGAPNPSAIRDEQ